MRALALLLLLAACGGDSGNSEEFERQEERVPEPETIQKIYRGDIRAVNPTVVNDVEGQVVLRLEDDSFEANVAARNVPEIEHAQSVRAGRSCPTIANDVNGDGVLDLREAEAVTGAAYIPLDSDLDSIVGDNLDYPTGGFLRAYAYREDTARAQLVAELGAEETIDFGNRVVLILGSGNDPTLPIGCAELTQVTGQ